MIEIVVESRIKLSLPSQLKPFLFVFYFWSKSRFVNWVLAF